jgi:periplasmic copper chaperone A
VAAFTLTLLMAAPGCERQTGDEAVRAALGELHVEEHIVIGDGWARSAPRGQPGAAEAAPAEPAATEPPPAGTHSAAYMRIQNRSEDSDRLLSASSPVAGVTELHQTTDEQGMARMRRVDAIDVQAGATVRLEPGGLHIMLIDLNRRLVRGDSVDLRLRFERAGEIHARIEVRD